MTDDAVKIARVARYVDMCFSQCRSDSDRQIMTEALKFKFLGVAINFTNRSDFDWDNEDVVTINHAP